MPTGKWDRSTAKSNDHVQATWKVGFGQLTPKAIEMWAAGTFTIHDFGRDENPLKPEF